MTFGRIRRLIVSGAILFSVITVQAQPGKILSVTDFGAVANSGRDATPAFRRALIACGNNRARILRFGKGRYDLYPDSALKREYFISNTSSEAECPSKVKTIGLLLERLHGLSLEGDETLLVFHGKMTPFVLDHCRSIRIRNLSVDFARPTMSEFTILQATADSIDVRVHPDSWYRLEKGKLVWYGEGWIQENYHCIRVDSRDGTMRYANDAYGQLMKASVREISPGRLRFTGHFIPRDFPPGNRFTVRDPVRDQVGGFIAYCRDITLDHLNLYYMHGLGIVSQYSENLHMNVIRVEPAPHSGRKIASFADALHFSGCRGQILIENCRFNGMHDDPVNIHGTHLRIIRQTAPDQLIVRFMHGQTYGFDAFFENDSVAFVHAATLQTYHFARVQRAIRLSDRDIQLTFREPVPSGRQDGDVLENITWTPAVTIRNCLFTGSNTRGLLVTTRRKVLIENNRFERLGMAAILIADDASSWYESGPVCDVLIRHNLFRDCGYNSSPGSYSISVAPENHAKGPQAVHRHIRIERNTFFCPDDPVLYARSVKGLRFIGNQVIFAENSAPPTTKQPTIQLTGCSQVVIAGNQVDPDQPVRMVLVRDMNFREVTLDPRRSLRVIRPNDQ